MKKCLDLFLFTMWIAWFAVLILSVWVFFSRLMPWVIARIVSLFLSQAKFRLGGIGKRLELFQSQLQFRNFDINVDNLRLTSSIFSSEASNLITIIATGVNITVLPASFSSGSESSPSQSGQDKPRNTKTLLLLAQFLGVQIRDVSLTVKHLPSLTDCQLKIQFGELRLDSSVIHRTKLSLALYLYQGNVIIHHTTGGPLLESSFAFQASIQALVGAGKITSVEDVNLDIDGLSLQMYSALFHSVLPVSPRINTTSSAASSKSYLEYSSFIPKAAQVKAECCSAVLEHSDRSSQLTGQLSLLYVCVKCSDPQRAGPGSLPDSHLTGQVSGLQVWANDNQEDTVLAVSKFQVLVQKEAATLHSDTQIHELSASGSNILLPWLDPVSWLVRTVEARRQSVPQISSTSPPPVVEKKSSWMDGLTHQHQLDAWNSHITLDINNKAKWKLSLHQV